MAKYDHYASPAGYPGGQSAPPPSAPAPHYDAEQGGTGIDDVHVGTSTVKVRLGFLRKVYTILTLNFMITVGIACLFALVKPIRSYVVKNQWLLLVGLVVGIATFLALACIKVRAPWNVMLLGLFVLGFSVMVGTISAAYYERGWGFVLLQAFAATAATFIGITLYIFVTKKDFSYLGSFLFGALICLVVLSFLTFFTGALLGRRSSRFLYFGISVLGALLMIGYLLYDTSLVVTKYGPDDWIIAVITLYTDVINLFLYLLSILSFIQT